MTIYPAFGSHGILPFYIAERKRRLLHSHRPLQRLGIGRGIRPWLSR